MIACATVDLPLACREELAPAVHGFYCDVADGIFAAPRRWLMTV
jgi:hypothetical protein